MVGWLLLQLLFPAKIDTMSLKQITTRAKQLYKTGKFKKWTDAIKAASKEIAGKPTKKARAKKIAAVNNIRNNDRPGLSFGSRQSYLEAVHYVSDPNVKVGKLFMFKPIPGGRIKKTWCSVHYEFVSGGASKSFEISKETMKKLKETKLFKY